MRFIRNLKIGTRLIISFVIVALISGVLGTMGIVQMKNIASNGDTLYKQNLVPLNPLNTVIVDFMRTRVIIRDIILDPQNFKTYKSTIDDLQSEIETALKEYESGITSNQERIYYEKVREDLIEYKHSQAQVLEYAKQKKVTAAYKILNTDMRPFALALDENITKIFKLNIAQAKQLSNENLDDVSRSSLLMLVLILCALSLALALGFIISRSISNPIKKLELAADKLARGDIDVNVASDSTDEIGKLMDSFGKMILNIQQQSEVATKIANGDLTVEVKIQSEADILSKSLKMVVDSLRHLIQDMDTMSAEHDAGDIDVFVPEDRFMGAYKIMAQGVNNMVKGHISIKKKAMACIYEFAKGNFDAELETFPGKKVFINQNIEALRENLKAVAKEINKLIIASNEGKLSERASIEGFHGDWTELIKGLNGLLDAIIKPIKEAATILEGMSKGDLQNYVTGNYRGDHATIKNALNNTITTLNAYVTEISNVLTEIANGNLVLSVDNDYKGDFAQIKISLNLIIDSLNNVLSDINSSAQQVASGARQVSDSAQMLSQGSTEQASSVEELTASMEQIAAQTSKNAENANTANTLASTSKLDAVHGNDQMKEMLKAMEMINESSGNISKIIKVIDEIAFQTNILALNAAVEAARAGQHGKGFAVVAEEVRNLAARSANAAKETTSLIEGSIKNVERGTTIATETANALAKIVGGIANATDLVADIAIASNEQTIGISQVNQGIMQVSQVVQSNSATSEESAAASQELSGQAEILRTMVGRFMLKNNPITSSINNDFNSNSVKRFIKEDQKNEVAFGTIINLSDKNFGKY